MAKKQKGPVHGQRVACSMQIERLKDKLTSDNLLALVVNNVNQEYYPHEVVQLSVADIENMVNVTYTTLANILESTSFDKSDFKCTLIFCEEGQEIGENADGTPILSKTGSTTFDKPFWRMDDKEIILSLPAQQMVDEIKATINLQVELAATNAKRENAKSITAQRAKAKASKSKGIAQLITPKGDDNPLDFI